MESLNILLVDDDPQRTKQNCVVILNSDSGNNSDEIRRVMGEVAAQIPDTVRIMSKRNVTLDFIKELVKALVSGIRNNVEAVLNSKINSEFGTPTS